MKVLFAAAEAAPFFKTGGLGDVVQALPKELVALGVDCRVVLPYFSKKIPDKFKYQLKDVTHFTFEVGGKAQYCGIKQLEYQGVVIYFIDNLTYFGRDSLYGYWDDGGRFGYFSLAAIEMLEVIDFIPDIIHCHDWHTAMIPALLVDKYHWKEPLQRIRKVLTIHNLRFQGIFPESILDTVFATGRNIFTEDGIKFYNQVNYLKGGINFSDRVTTVSPSYAEEIKTPEFGESLDGTLRYNDWKLSGIINGIDTTYYDPETDPHLKAPFSLADLKGKVTNKMALQKELGLPVDDKVAMIGVVSRLTDQKGFQLLAEIGEELLQAQIQLVILGTGEPQYEQAFSTFESRHPEKCRAIIAFDEGLAQRIYAASDLFLMPSAFEPCGLSQMMAMHYGSLPVVHETGGLRDTVVPYNQYTESGTGFSFQRFDSYWVLAMINKALELYYDHPKIWRKLVKEAMSKDFSWNGPAKDYLALYTSLIADDA